jgi:hypothetical protein
MNTAVLPATFEITNKLFLKGVGKLSKGMEGMSVDNLHKILKLAVIEQMKIYSYTISDRDNN